MNAQDGYYGRPVLKEPVWTAMVPAYFFAGGLAGMSAALAFGARLAGNRQLARRALLVSLAGISASPPLLVADLGRPERFLNMLRVVKPTSPMSVGTWVLSAFGTALGGAVVAELLGGPLRAIGRVAEPAAALLGLPLSTYTAVLVSDTAVPAWHEARHELPFLFAGSAAASAGAAAAILTPPRQAGPARRLAIFAGLVELAATVTMERRLGAFADVYHRGRAGHVATAAKVLTAAGAGLMAAAGRRRPRTVLAGCLLLAGSLGERFAVLAAGRESARETIGERTVTK